MKQFNIYGGIDEMSENHPQIEGKTINNNYYGSELNKFSAENCRKDIVINNIDLIINNYKDNSLKIVESKHLNEKLSTGQHLLLKKLSKIGINTYVVYGNYPYNDYEYKIYCYQSKTYKKGTKKQLIEFLQK